MPQAEEMRTNHRRGASSDGQMNGPSVAGWTGRLAASPEQSNTSVSSLQEFQAWLRQILFEVLLLLGAGTRERIQRLNAEHLLKARVIFAFESV